MARFDAHSKYDDLKGVGKVLGKVIRRCVSELDPISWAIVFTELPWEEGDVASAGAVGGGDAPLVE